MAVNLFPPENLLPVDGIRLSAVSAGIRYQGRDDLVLMELVEGSQCAAVFTKNAFCAAPVIVAREHLTVTSPRYLLINSGNANAGTGDQGLQTAKATCAELAKLVGDCQAEAVLPFSTGVIGEQLPLECFQGALPAAIEALASDHWAQAAAGIMTTDTVAKAVSRQVELDGGVVTITGISKGSGMIHPNMATMLAYVATDALAGQDTLQSLLTEVANETFNCITVDGDTSTNDALILAATGQSGVPVAGDNLVVFRRALQEVCLYLAQAIVRDGEGATKFISIDVEGAGTRDEARAVGETVALSPLVKTAMFASDPNWGRILAAIGRSPVEDLDVSKVTVWLGDTLLVENGQPAASYTEEQGQRVMKQDEITVRISLGRGDIKASTWTCDFSYDYVKINAEYRS